MKEIIYLNTDLMNSMIAQLNRGIISGFSQEQNNQESQTAGQQSIVGERAGLKGEFRLGTGFLPGGEVRFGSSLGHDGAESTNESRTILEGEKDILNKEFHDYTLDILTNMLRENNLLKDGDNLKEGDVLLGESTFNFYDFELIRKSLNPDFFQEFILADIIDEQISYDEAKKIVNKSGNLTAAQREKLESARKVFEAYEIANPVVNIINLLNKFSTQSSNLLGGLSVIKADNKIGLVKNIYLRETAESLSFRTDTSRKVKFLVRIIGEKNIVYNGFNIPEIQPSEIGKVPNIILDVLLGSMEIIEKGDLLVTPIAIYYE